MFGHIETGRYNLDQTTLPQQALLPVKTHHKSDLLTSLHKEAGDKKKKMALRERSIPLTMYINTPLQYV